MRGVDLRDTSAAAEVVRRVEQYRARTSVVIAILLVAAVATLYALMEAHPVLTMLGVVIACVGTSRAISGHLAARRLPALLDEVAAERRLSAEELDALAMEHATA